MAETKEMSMNAKIADYIRAIEMDAKDIEVACEGGDHPDQMRRPWPSVQGLARDIRFLCEKVRRYADGPPTAGTGVNDRRCEGCRRRMPLVDGVHAGPSMISDHDTDVIECKNLNKANAQ